MFTLSGYKAIEKISNIEANNDSQPFVLARHEGAADWFGQQTLIGREQEQQQIIDMLVHTRKSRAGVISISGEEGIGKTYLIENTLANHILPDDVYVKVCCEQDNQLRPYSICGQVIENLVHYLLTERHDLSRWKRKVMEAIRGSEANVVELAPNLQLLIGEQTQITVETEPNENLSRAITNFLQLFLENARLFVLFIDNFHYVDEQSKNYLNFLLQNHKMKGFLVIKAYREDVADVLLTNPSNTTVSRLHIKLEKYDAYTVEQLLQPYFSGAKKERQMLVQLLLKKTAGNPLLLKQLLQEIAEKELLTFDSSNDNWIWDLYGIAALTNENMKDESWDVFLKFVDRSTSKLLSSAAFLGSPFKLTLLAEMTGYTTDQLREFLQIPINYQLIYNVCNEQQLYTFQNEEIQQVFYRQVEKEERAALHMSAGLVLEKYVEEDETVTIPRLLSHFNEVKEQLVRRGKQLKLIQLNFEAAKEESAPDKAIYYLEHSVDLLDETYWQQYYEMTYSIYKLRAELAFLSGQYDVVGELCNVLIVKSQTNLDKAKVYTLLMQMELSFDNYAEVLTLGERTLNLLQTPIEMKIGKMKEWYYWLRISGKLGKVPSKKY